MKYLITILALALTACATAPTPVLVPEPKPHVNPKLLELCNTDLDLLPANATFADIVANHGQTIARLADCSCKQKALRNFACAQSNNDCKPVAECEAPNDTEHK